VAGSCGEHGNEISGSIRWEDERVFEHLSDYQLLRKGLYSMDLVNNMTYRVMVRSARFLFLPVIQLNFMPEESHDTMSER
jgi:hypothetical protein